MTTEQPDCCCDPPNPGIELRRSLAGCAGDCINSVTYVDVTIPALGSNPFPFPCSWTPSGSSVVITDLWGDGGFSFGASGDVTVSVGTACDGVDDPDSIITVTVQNGPCSTSAQYTLADGCIGTYTRVGASIWAPSTISVAYT